MNYFISKDVPHQENYGEDCFLPCPQNCQEGHFHIVDGTCLSCVEGYQGSTCEERQYILVTNATYELV